ncbi:dual specificity protein phosphatase 18-like [Anopheles bellator]|uniref:dual specificity protein phosphatase 18-like n=1 Tax=Anopheles bellator TaxID=139047 RepID=UPI0026499815|nr:dual specificity protein phosphatase 18-like [Anopheles bellator]
MKETNGVSGVNHADELQMALLSGQHPQPAIEGVTKAMLLGGESSPDDPQPPGKPDGNQIQALLERHEGAPQGVPSAVGRPMRSFSPISGVSKLLKNLYLCGGSAASVAMMKQLGVTFVINVTMPTELTDTPLPAADTRYLRLPVKDNREANLERYFHEVADMIEEESNANGVTLVHCVAGISRSATLCLAYLMKHHRMSLKDAYNHIKAKRPQIRPNVSFVKQLMEFEQLLVPEGSQSVALVYCHALGEELPDIYEPEFRTMELLYQKFRRNIARR